MGGVGMLKTKLLQVFALLVLLVGGLFGLFGWRLFQNRILAEAQKQVQLDIGSAWALFRGRMRELETIVHMTTLKRAVVDAASGDQLETLEDLQQRLELIQRSFKLDFLNLVSPQGKVMVRASGASRVGDSLIHNPAVRRALKGEPVAGLVLLDPDDLARENPDLSERALLTLEPTPHARPTQRAVETRGLTMVAAYPVFRGLQLLGVIYGGQLLNRNEELVDSIAETIFKGERYQGSPLGSATIFLHDVRVATTVRLPNGNRAIGTRASKEVADRVLDNAESWGGPAFVVKESYLTAYDPLLDLDGRVVGMLYVGRLERPFHDLERSTLLQFGELCLAGLTAALLLSLIIAGRLSRPIRALVQASQRMHRGEPHAELRVHSSCHEIETLIQSFNKMAAALEERQARLNTANAELARKSDDLVALNRSYMDMLCFVSHELKSPVASMQNYAYLLKNETLGPLTERQRMAINSIEGGTSRLVEMVRHYLCLARIENGEMTPLRSPVRVREDILDPLVEFMTSAIQARRQRVQNDVPAGLVLQADSNMLNEVFENLLGNAVKYGSEGAAIRLTAKAEDGAYRFAVRNDGPGFTDEQKARLFGKFSRLSGDLRGHGRGTGLGLFITRKIVEAHGGTIEAESKPGEWAEFRFTIPGAVMTARRRPAVTSGR